MSAAPDEREHDTFTPSTEQVRSHYVFDQSNRWDPERGKAFDRWLASEVRRSREATTESRPITDADVEVAGRAIAAEQGVRYPGSMRTTWDRLARAALEAVEASRSPKPTD